MHGETYSFDNSIEIRAVPGSLVGHTLVENGYILKELSTGNTVCYEPHGSHSKKIKQGICSYRCCHISYDQF